MCVGRVYVYDTAAELFCTHAYPVSSQRVPGGPGVNQEAVLKPWAWGGLGCHYIPAQRHQDVLLALLVRLVRPRQGVAAQRTRGPGKPGGQARAQLQGSCVDIDRKDMICTFVTG